MKSLMELIKKIKKSFMKHVLRRKFENNDFPGFATAEVGFGDIGFEARIFYVPETLIANLETNIEEEFGEEGVHELYSAGKIYGWEYAGLAGFPNVIENDKDEILKAFSTMAHYIELTQTEKLEYDFDFDKSLYTAEYVDPKVLRINDRSYTFLLGTGAGFLAYVMQNPEVESARAEKLGKNKYRVQTGPTDQIEPLTRFTDLKDVFHNRKYGVHNKARKFEGKAMTDLMKMENCYKDAGNFYLQDKIHLSFEAGLIHLLEKRLSELDSREILFETGFEEGKKMDLKDRKQVKAYLTGTGWGHVEIDDEGVEFDYFPWHPAAVETGLNLFRGYVSGLISSTGSQIKYSSTEIEQEQGNLKVRFTE